jgi:hypothetical protein
MVDLLDRSPDDPEVQQVHGALVTHPQVTALIADAVEWPGPALKRHNDAKHLLYAVSTLADFGVRADDPGMARVVEAIVTHQAPDGAFQSLVNIPKAFGGPGGDRLTWMLCDAPTLLYALLAFGPGDDARVRRASAHLSGLARENGFPCAGAPELGRFRGPGRKSDPCPIANTCVLKALSMAPAYVDSPPTRAGVAMLLDHWGHRGEQKLYLFGVGSDFHKLKYPFVWYDILHVADVLSRFPFACTDPRLVEMVEAITAQADGQGRYTASSMYRAWKGWSFADKKRPSPWLTFLVLRIQGRMAKACHLQ